MEPNDLIQLLPVTKMNKNVNYESINNLILNWYFRFYFK
jgi:hypothetical protein